MAIYAARSWVGSALPGGILAAVTSGIYLGRQCLADGQPPGATLERTMVHLVCAVNLNTVLPIGLHGLFAAIQTLGTQSPRLSPGKYCSSGDQRHSALADSAIIAA